VRLFTNRPLAVSLVVLVISLGTLGSRAAAPAALEARRVVAAPVPTPAPELPVAAAVAAPADGPVWTPVQAAAEAGLAGRQACLVVRRDGRTVAAHQPDTPLATASTQKLLVAAAALRALGPEHRFTTTVRGTPVVDGAVDDLWLVGGGDPMLATPAYAAYLPTTPRWQDHPPTSLAALADSIVAAGVRRVNGTVRADDTRHELVRTVEGWKASYLDGTVSPISALSVNGGWSTWTPPRTSLADPPLDTARMFVNLLRERGVHVTAEPVMGAAPPNSGLVAEVRSAPLRAVLTGVLKASDNMATEMILREVGLRVHRSATTEAGARAVTDVLGAAGIDVAGLGLRDGSGLHPGNRATCRTLAETIDAVGELGGMLAVAGRNGTLNQRFVGSPLEGRLTGKTGWIAGVVGLAGRFDDRTTFAILQNDVPSLLDGRTVEESLLHAVAGSLPP